MRQIRLEDERNRRQPRRAHPVHEEVAHELEAGDRFHDLLGVVDSREGLAGHGDAEEVTQRLPTLLDLVGSQKKIWTPTFSRINLTFCPPTSKISSLSLGTVLFTSSLHSLKYLTDSALPASITSYIPEDMRTTKTIFKSLYVRNHISMYVYGT